MKGSGLFSLLSLLLFCTFAAAWPWPKSYPEMGGLLRRQDQQSSEARSATSRRQSASAAASGTITDGPQASRTGASASGDSAAATSGGDATQASGSGSRRPSRTSGSRPKETNFDPRLPAGGIAMITPAVIGGPQYYKAGDFITFAWNYTSVKAMPSNIDILVSCTYGSRTYTLATNQTAEATGSIVWDTIDGYQVDDYAVASYTLIVKDSQQDISARPSPGYLAVASQFTFGMYTPQPYTPLNAYKCATCSAALSLHEKQALSLLVGMGTITVLSFTWFAGGFGVFW